MNKFVFNPITGQLDLVNSSDAFITDGTNGITTIRWSSTPSGVLFNMTLDDTGHVVTTAVVVAGSKFIPVWFTLIPQ